MTMLEASRLREQRFSDLVPRSYFWRGFEDKKRGGGGGRRKKVYLLQEKKEKKEEKFGTRPPGIEPELSRGLKLTYRLNWLKLTLRNTNVSMPKWLGSWT